MAEILASSSHHSYGAVAQEEGGNGARRRSSNGSNGEAGRVGGGWAGVRAMARVIALHHKTAVKRVSPQARKGEKGGRR